MRCGSPRSSPSRYRRIGLRRVQISVETPEHVPEIGEEEPPEVLEVGELFNPRAVAKYVSMWVIGPSVSLALSYAFFAFLPFVG
ncbi:MAG: hypothetical protein IH933_12235 [Euryarchaeota archaeon]|nr:hypothetical protein [Euryarchaeota archaeon]